jgi:hypothetical protein
MSGDGAKVAVDVSVEKGFEGVPVVQPSWQERLICDQEVVPRAGECGQTAAHRCRDRGSG